MVEWEPALQTINKKTSNLKSGRTYIEYWDGNGANMGRYFLNLTVNEPRKTTIIVHFRQATTTSQFILCFEGEVPAFTVLPQRVDPHKSLPTVRYSWAYPKWVFMESPLRSDGVLLDLIINIDGYSVTMAWKGYDYEYSN